MYIADQISIQNRQPREFLSYFEFGPKVVFVSDQCVLNFNITSSKKWKRNFIEIKSIAKKQNRAKRRIKFIQI